jgi:hypothetical protein
MISGDRVRQPRWLSDEQSAILKALTVLIIPSDEMGPGAAETELWRRLETALDRFPDRQQLYREGLPCFDTLARRLYGRPLAALSGPQQRSLLLTVERAHRSRHGGGSQWHHRLRRRFVSLIHQRRGWTAAVSLFPVLVTDAIESFYCSSAAWQWLRYAGPPFPNGWYPSLQREALHG